MPDGRIRVAFLADVQIGCMATFSGMDGDALARFAKLGMLVRSFPATTSLQWDTDRFAAAVSELNRIQPDLAVVGGDMVDDMAAPAQLETFLDIAAATDVPFHFAPGNHDICPDAVVPTVEAVDWYRAHFGPEHQTLTMKLADDAQLTVLTANSAVLDQPRGIDGAFEAEMAWLEEALVLRPSGPTIVVSHHPPFVDHPEEGPDYWNIPPERRRPFLDLLAARDVDLLLCGHRHLNDHAEYRGVEIVTTAAVGFPLGTDPPGFRLVDVTESAITHTFHPLSDPGWESIGGPPDPEAGHVR